MTRTLRLIVMFVAALVLGTILSVAASMDHGLREAKILDRLMSVQTWTELRSVYRRYRHLEDGIVAQAFSERIETLLSERPCLLPELELLTRHDRTFNAFVLRYVGSGLFSEKATKAIEANVRTYCKTRAQTVLCRGLGMAMRSVYDFSFPK